MNARENHVETVFHAALELPEGRELNEFLAGETPAVALRVRRLLEMHMRHDGLRDTDRISQPSLADEKAGESIGPYKLRQQIGEGGFGVVWMAEQERPVRRWVALKIIKMGMDTKEVIARFEQERQALAMMEHPNIAKVFDAGATNSGRPYFVMELVRGVKITDYCDNAILPTTERLRLFVQVCHAVQHAHQKGIIHRDLKPSNILVTLHDGVPVPKVIDFGVAKATQQQRLTDLTLFTQFQQMIGTPLYMSPEQAEMSGLDVDTRSDIYSLGVLLYELLTGRTPFDPETLRRAGQDEVRRLIREQDPPRPSTALQTMKAELRMTVARNRQADAGKMAGLLRGDLDWILMKALEKDRTRRYQTANGFALDIQRHLADEIITARPPGNLYRIRKSIRRNRLAFAATGAVAAALILGLAASTWLFFRENQARERAVGAERIARSETAKSRQVARFLKDTLAGTGPSVALGRDTTMLREILDKTAERIGTDLRDHPEVEIELRLTLIEAYGDLQLYPEMVEMARETVRVSQAHFGNDNLATADALGHLGVGLMISRQIGEAESTTRRAIAMQRKLRGPGSLQEASSLINLGDVLRHRCSLAGDPADSPQLAEAEAVIRAGLAIRRKRLGNETSEVTWGLYSLGLVLRVTGQLDEAEATARERLEIARKLYGEDHPETGGTYVAWAEVLAQRMRFAEAESTYRKGLAILNRLEGPGKWHHAYAYSGFADVMEKQGRLEEAEAGFRTALATARSATGGDHPDMPQHIGNLANILWKNGKLAEARALAEESVELCLRQPGQADRWMQDFAFDTLEEVLRDLGDSAASEAMFRQRVALDREISGNGHPFVAASLAQLTRFLLDQKRFAEAGETARECLAIRETRLPDDWLTFHARCLVGESSLGRKKFAEAEALLISGYTGMKQRENKIPPAGKPCLREALQCLVQVCGARGETEKAAGWSEVLAAFDLTGAEMKPGGDNQ